MTLTPRQIWAYLEFCDRLDCRDQADALVTTAIGTQGEKQAIDKRLKELHARAQG